MIVDRVLISSDLVDKHFPLLTTELGSRNIQYEVKDSFSPLTVILVFTDLYRTQWEVFQGSPGKREVRMLYCPNAESFFANLDYDIVIARKGSDESMRIGRLICSQAKFIEINSKDEFPVALVHIVDVYNKYDKRKLPTPVNTYKPVKVGACSTDQETLLAGMLAQIHGISSKVAKELAMRYGNKLLTGLPFVLDNLGPAKTNKLTAIFDRNATADRLL